MASDTQSIPRTEYLIDHIRLRLSNSPITHPLTITVIESRPKRTTSLFPYVEETPKVWVQQVLVTVAADVKQDETADTAVDAPSDSISAEPNILHVTEDSGNPHSNTDSAASKNNRKLFICAMEAYVFHVPATSSCLVYISKVDSTGYHPDIPWSTEKPIPDATATSEQPRSRLPPITYYLLKAFLSFYHPLPPSRALQIRRSHHHRHAYVTLFARSATQYLFPNSILGGKKVLGGLKLCKWWKRTFEDVVVDLQREQQAVDDRSTVSEVHEKYLTYCLPGYDHLEARSLVGVSASLTAITNEPGDRVEWQYLPPADPSLNSLLFPPSPGPMTPEHLTERKQRPLGMLVPTFDDDPKARFLVELVMNSPVEKLRKGKGRRNIVAEEVDNEEQPDAKRQKLDSNTMQQAPTPASTTIKDEHATASAASSTNVLKDLKERRRKDELKLRQQDAAALQAISWDDFWTRMGYRQECISGDVTGFFSMYVGLPATVDTAAEPTSLQTETEELEAPSTSPHQISHPLFTRIGVALLNHDFANLTLAIEGTRRFLDQTENIVVAEIGEELWKTRCVARVESNEKGKAFQERKRINGTDEGRVGGTEQSAQPVVNVLQIKKKKKLAK
ncbi:hypothetical protein QFC22_004586 [Naganishia vaughanmartiniae]|uniref:Uncharacterized protein n=1 Tax=Naganishia vaughanmartiniae TaxID=1424756 RepID=A0ACC2WZN3_9TREE|nr:hypothetical protein QFC22_004586 [Naganishia vaughanmartiniae]